MSASSPRWCFVCVSLLYNGPNPQADRDNIDSMSLYLFLSWGLIQQKSRQRQKGETTKRLEYRKELITGVLECSIWCVSLDRFETELNCPFHRSPFTSPTGERHAAFADISNISKHSYLPTEHNSTNVCRGTLVWVTILSSSQGRCWTVFPPWKCSFLKQPSRGLDQRPGVAEMRSGPRTAPLLGGRAHAANFSLVSESRRLKVSF